MGSPNISESLNRFFTVAHPGTGFDANDVINMNGGAAQKAGTFHKWNIFRCVGRSKDEVNANNNTRQQFLNALKESFDLTETGQALVDRLADILGKGVFKPEDYSFDKDGKLDSGKPLTTRRITDVYEAMTGKSEGIYTGKGVSVGFVGKPEGRRKDEVFSKLWQIDTKIYNLVDDNILSISGKLEDDWEDTGFLVPLREGLRDIGQSRGNVYMLPRLLGLSIKLRMAIANSRLPFAKSPEDRNKLADDVVNALKNKFPVLVDLCEKQEKLIDEYYELTGCHRQEMDAQQMRSIELAVR